VTDEHDLRPTIRSEETTKKLSQTKDLDQMVPGFRLLQKLGEGGMGEVFEAEQLEPVRRKVALKLIKRGMESKEVLARFDSERQALALMSHPNIAQVYDAGTTSDGRPYFVMEFVQGVPVTRYCDTNRLTTNERLELFTQICEGVQHAHQKGVIHRDLKPSNVLVKVQDSKPVPKIIDFGVSKAIAQRLTEQTLFTAIGEFIGTPEYMSPEQAEMTELDIDTRTDVYALGVVLYELLVGAQPFDAAELRRSGFDEMRRKIREDEPPRPSMRLSAMGERSVTAAENRRSEPSTLSRKIHGDLDWITMKALEKDRTRRYDSRWLQVRQARPTGSRSSCGATPSGSPPAPLLSWLWFSASWGPLLAWFGLGRPSRRQVGRPKPPNRYQTFWSVFSRCPIRSRDRAKRSPRGRCSTKAQTGSATS
jgi:serine/threonine protein kinase